MIDLGSRMVAIRVRFGARGNRTTCAGFARELGIERGRLYKWETRPGANPEGGIAFLETIYSRVPGVTASGVSSRALALWALTGEGDLAALGLGALSAQPEVRDPRRTPELGAQRPATPLQPGEPAPTPPEAVRALQKAIDAASKGEDPLPLIQFAADAIAAARATFRQAKQLGLAAVVSGAGLAFAVLPGDGLRHNAKVCREELAEWAERELRRSGGLRILRGTAAV